MRGYQKRVIYMKNPGSDLFEEAYFVIKEGAYSEAVKTSVIDEAERIIEENSTSRVKCQRRILPQGALFFAAGVICAAAVFIVINLI